MRFFVLPLLLAGCGPSPVTVQQKAAPARSVAAAEARPPRALTQAAPGRAVAAAVPQPAIGPALRPTVAPASPPPLEGTTSPEGRWSLPWTVIRRRDGTTYRRYRDGHTGPNEAPRGRWAQNPRTGEWMPLDEAAANSTVRPGEGAAPTRYR